MAGRVNHGRLTLQEIHRFPNDPVVANGSMYWDVLGLWREMRSALASLASHGIARVDSIGIDTWGVDYALLGERGVLLENPYCYRDARTDGAVERVVERLGRAHIYGITGIQFMQINTLYQIFAASERTPELLRVAKTFLTVPDLFNFWLTGRAACEYTNATTTQFLDAAKRGWSLELLGALGIPTHLFGEIVQPGTALGPLAADLRRLPELESTQVIAPACHDTGSAVAAVRAGGSTAFISSGTWALLGTEVPRAISGPEAARLNFTNEGGVCGTVRLLKNITGMWLLEGCRKSPSGNMGSFAWDDLLAMSAPEPAFAHLVDPDDASFTRPDDMTAAIDAFCRRTGQAAPNRPGAYVRCILESLALKYRVVLEQLESLAGTRFTEIRVIGGGSQNTMLNQMTADATGRRVLAGPVEATALGNLAMQLVGMGVVSLDAARDLIEQSYPPRVFEPRSASGWDAAILKFRSLIG